MRNELRALRSLPSRWVLAVGTLIGQVTALAVPDLRPFVLLSSLLVLEGLGVVFSLRAARHGASRLTWRLAAAGRIVQVVSLIAFTVDAVAANALWWWVGVLSGLVMFVLFAATAMTVSTQRLPRSQWWGLVAEVVAMLSSCLMLTWYFVLQPTLSEPGPRWVSQLGNPLGSLTVLVTVGAVMARGAVVKARDPLTVLLGGLLIYSIGDIVYSAIGVHNGRASDSAAGGAILVLASLLMTVAAMAASAHPLTRRAAPVVSKAPIWSVLLPYVAVGLANSLMVAVTIRQHAFAVWGGLTLGQGAMTTALAVRQLISLRDSRRLNITDPLTGLFNRTGKQEALDRALRRGHRPAMLLLDLDGFKQVNDRYGHAVGDLVLIEFSRLLRQSVRSGDTVARIGGDEFVVVLDDVADEDQAVRVAQRILAVLAANPSTATGTATVTQVSIGLTIAQAGDIGEDLKRRADLAMYESKRSGAHGWRMYDPTMIDRRARDALLTEELRQAVGTEQITVVYQPVVDLDTHRTVAAEALLRWQHPTLGPISPVEFIPVAERSGLIHQLGMHVLNETCAHVRRWRQDIPGQQALRVGVNVSAVQLRDPAFVQHVLNALHQADLPANGLCLEITETAIVEETTAVPTLEALRKLGILVAIDDFGTGYSSLHQITRLPVDVLKIDRSFVSELDRTSRGAAVAEAIIRLAQVLNLRTVAEGIETAAQATELHLLGCSTAQGYLFARPMTAADFSTHIGSASPTAERPPRTSHPGS